jgi:HPt (histidine-containing phosphotransfer) domain-containing protein
VSEKILDQETLEQLRVFLGDEVEQLLQDFVRTVPQRLQQFSSAMGAGDSDGACSIVHALKSSSGNLGLLAFSGLCRNIEESLRSGESNEKWAAELSDSFQQAAAAIQA